MSRIERLQSGRVRVYLDPSEVEEVEECLREMDPSWHKNNPNTKRMGKDSMEARREGFLGEYAVAEFYGTEFRSATTPDDGADLIIDGKWRMNVKSVPWRYLGRPLLHREEARNPNCHAYCLCVVDEKRGIVEIIGTCPAKKLHEAEVVDYGNGPCRRLTEGQLNRPRGRPQEEEPQAHRGDPRASGEELEEDPYPADAIYPWWWEENVAWEKYIR